MKCVKAIKSTKTTEVGTIVRINDADAESRVKGGNWKYVPKSEWKSLTKTTTEEKTTTE
jgi:hypothetical protein